MRRRKNLFLQKDIFEHGNHESFNFGKLISNKSNFQGTSIKFQKKHVFKTQTCSQHDPNKQEAHSFNQLFGKIHLRTIHVWKQGKSMFEHF